jgi:alpha-mannosidase
MDSILKVLDEAFGCMCWEVKRFKYEVNFAVRLTNALPEKKDEWDYLIRETTRLVAQNFGKKDIKSLIEEAEKMLSPIGEVAKTFTIHYVGHAHIDMNWAWDWPETVDTAYKTFTTVNKLMDEFPDFKFSQSQTSVYSAMEKYNPETFEMIKERVKKGRWEVTANSWVEGDKNLASGEALIRHILYTKRYFKEKFGLAYDAIKIDWEPDTFGHHWMHPQILKKSGITRYYFCRAGKGPRIFWWEAPDGSRVLAWDDGKLWYLGPVKPEDVVEAVELYKNTGMKDYLVVYGVGDHGGGPTKKDLQLIEEMKSWRIFPKVKCSTTDEFFSIAEKYGDKFPVVRDELNFVFRGCYTSQSNIKEANRKAENLLTTVEVIGVLANKLTGKMYSEELLKEGWINTLFNQFHDILAGSGIPETYRYAQGLYQNTKASGNMVMESSLKAIVEEIDTEINGNVKVVPIVVFNPLPWRRTDVVTVDIYDVFDEKDNLVLIDENKNVIPMQYRKYSFFVELLRTIFPATEIPGEGYISPNGIKVVFTAEDIPGYGYKTYYLKYSEGERTSSQVMVSDMYRGQVTESGVRAGSTYIVENQFYKVTVSAGIGAITSIIDKSTDKEILPKDGRAGLLQILYEAPHPMSAWEIGQIIRTVDLDKDATVEVVETGPARAIIRSRRKYNDSEFILDVILNNNVPRIDFRLELFWLEKGSKEVGVPMLKIAFPLDITEGRARFEIPFGSIERPTNGEEVPALKWVDLTGIDKEGKELGIALSSTTKYGYDVKDNTIRMTILRSSYEPDPVPERGKYEFTFSLLPHIGKLAPSSLTRFGNEVNYPLISYITDMHTGKLNKSLEIIKVQPENVLVSILKKAEDDNDMILRVYETDGYEVEAKVIFGLPIKSYVETNLLEQPIGNEIQCKDNTIVFHLKPYEIKTIKIR